MNNAEHKRPWYYDWENEVQQAENFICAYDSFPARSEKAVFKELESFAEASRFKVIYESNRIEKAGLNESDTKKLILNDEDLKQSDKVFEEIARLFEEKYASGDAKQGCIIFNQKKRTSLEVINHYLAITRGENLVYNARAQMMYQELESREKQLQALSMAIPSSAGFPSSKMANIPRRPSQTITSLFDEKTIRHLHFTMACGLMPKDASVEAGFYRVDARTTDFTIAFPSHQNVPRAMEQFVVNANKLLNSDENPIMKAAKISYHFVAIHPFPDFNGRMSRLIMNMVLLWEGLPFFASLRGSKVEKHKYITALRLANRGKIESYACLIAKAVNDGFRQLNNNLELAGLDLIRPE